MPLNNSFHAPWLPVRTLFNFLISGRHFSWRSEAIFRVHQLKKKREFLLSFPALFMALKSLYYWRHINSTNLNCSGKKNVSVPLFNWFWLKRRIVISKLLTYLPTWLFSHTRWMITIYYLNSIETKFKIKICYTCILKQDKYFS